MSQAAVVNAVATKVAAFAGVVAVFRGEPEDATALPFDQFPLAIIETGAPAYQQISFQSGGAGLVQVEYDVDVRLWLGAQDMTPQEAEPAQLGLAEEFRKAFFSDFTLGGIVFDCTIQRTANNLADALYRKTGENPEWAARLRVTEHQVINS